MRKHGQPAALRHLLPGLLVLALGALGVAALLGAPGWPVLLVSALYAAAVLCAALLIASGSGWQLLPRLPVVIAAYHMGYGLGSVLGWIDVLAGAKSGRQRFARITR
jgi:succinoglycan biosynthesis protein ExoA